MVDIKLLIMVLIFLFCNKFAFEHRLRRSVVKVQEMEMTFNSFCIYCICFSRIFQWRIASICIRRRSAFQIQSFVVSIFE